LQISQAKVKSLQTRTWLLHDALERKNIRHSELVLVQNNHIFEDDDDDDPYQQPIQKQLNEPALDMNANEIQLPLSKPIIRPWEEIKNNKHIIGIGYEKEVTFHIPDYTKPIKFQSVGLLREGSYSPAPIQE
jgi:hypothetical protein